MPSTAKVAIVAALEREVRPLIKQWRSVERDYDGRKYKFFENDRAVLVCSGIGAEAARRATEAIIKLYAPVLVQSAGFAGALDPTLKVGTVLTPICVIDAKDGSRGCCSRRPGPRHHLRRAQSHFGQSRFRNAACGAIYRRRWSASNRGLCRLCCGSTLALAASLSIGAKQLYGSDSALRMARAIQRRTGRRGRSGAGSPSRLWRPHLAYAGNEIDDEAEDSAIDNVCSFGCTHARRALLGAGHTQTGLCRKFPEGSDSARRAVTGR